MARRMPYVGPLLWLLATGSAHAAPADATEELGATERVDEAPAGDEVLATDDALAPDDATTEAPATDDATTEQAEQTLPAPAPDEAGPSEPEPPHGGEATDPPTAEETDEADEADEPLRHRGFIIDARIGVMGCTGRICRNHDAQPGVRIDGVLGRNFLGFVDLGLAAGWGRMGTHVAPGTSGLALYGLDLDTLPEEAQQLALDQFTVDGAHLDALHVGLDLRVHFIPRGRFDPYVGVGLQYGRLRALYDTPAGDTRLGFHGLTFPLQAGMVVFVHRLVAVGAQFDYLLSWYGALTVRGAPGRLTVPIPLIADAAAMAGVDLPGDLPDAWTVGAVLHLRLGR